MEAANLGPCAQEETHSATVGEESAPLKPSLGAHVPEEWQTAGPAAGRDGWFRAQEPAVRAELGEGTGSFVFFMIHKPLHRG